MGKLQKPRKKIWRVRLPRAPGKPGKHIGRPKAVLNRLRIVQLRGEGMSWREIARRVGLPVSTVYRYRGLLNNSTAHFERT